MRAESKACFADLVLERKEKKTPGSDNKFSIHLYLVEVLSG